MVFYWSAFFTLAIMAFYLLFLATDPTFGTPTLAETVWVMSWMPPLCGLILGVFFTIMFFFFPWLEKRFDKKPQLELPL